MRELIEKMEKYALDYNIPIMQADGLDFMMNFIKSHQIKNILEIGAAIGYSAIRMCMLDEDIHVTTIERDEKRYNEAIKNIKEAKLEDRIHIVLGDALEYEFEGKYDFIFIDAAKAQYIKFFERFVPNLSQNGYIISDNLSFHGMVDPSAIVESRNVRQLVRKIRNYIDYLEVHPDFKTTFYELGDGIAVTEYKKMSFDGYIFDMDGLLIDSETVAKEMWQVVARRHNVELPWHVYEKFLGRTLAGIEEIFKNEVSDTLDLYDFYKEVRQEMNKHFEENGMHLLSGVKELLDYLKENGKKIAVATSSYKDNALFKLDSTGITDYFDEIITGDMVENGKPNPDIFLLAQEKLGTNKLNTVIFEDSNMGIEAAHRANIRSIMIPGVADPTEDSKKNAFMINNSLNDVVEYLKESK